MIFENFYTSMKLPPQIKICSFYISLISFFVPLCTYTPPPASQADMALGNP